MTANGATVLVAGATREGVDRIARRLDAPLSVCTAVINESGWPSTDVDVVLYADGTSADPVPTLGTNVREVLVADGGESSYAAGAFDGVLAEPLDADELQMTVESLGRQARYDRRLRECAELAAQCGESNGRGDSAQRCDRITAAKEELDGLVAQFSSDDFRRAFQTLAAD